MLDDLRSTRDDVQPRIEINIEVTMTLNALDRLLRILSSLRNKSNSPNPLRNSINRINLFYFCNAACEIIWGLETGEHTHLHLGHGFTREHAFVDDTRSTHQNEIARNRLTLLRSACEEVFVNRKKNIGEEIYRLHSHASVDGKLQ